MSWMGAYGLGMLGGIGSAAQGNYPNSFNPYMGGQQAARDQLVMQQYAEMLSQEVQRRGQPQETPKKPKAKFGSTIKALKDELQEETDKWLAGVLDA